MATNKHAIIRYQALDACFANKYRRFFMEDLIDACNKALEEFYSSKDDAKNDVDYYVKKRTIFNDIAFMESSRGWNAPIMRCYEGHRCYYRYENQDFSINRKAFSDAELDKLDEALIMLNRLNGCAGKPEKIQLKFSKKQYPYVETKPIHPSQTVIDKDRCIIQLEVFQNPELESVILSFGNQVEVLEPLSLREKIKHQVEELEKTYNSAE